MTFRSPTVPNGPSTASSEMLTIYVDGQRGNDSARHRGSFDSPFATINAALTYRQQRISMDQDVVIYINGADSPTPGDDANALVYEERLILNLLNFRRTHLRGYGAQQPKIRHSVTGEFAVTVTNLTAAGLAAAEADAAIDWTLADTGITWDGPNLNGREYVPHNVSASITDFDSSLTNIRIEGTDGAHGLLILGAADNASFNFLRALRLEQCSFQAEAPGIAFAAKNWGTSHIVSCHANLSDIVIFDCCPSLLFQGTEESNAAQDGGIGAMGFEGNAYIRATRGLPATEGNVLTFAYRCLNSNVPLFFNKLVTSQGSDAQVFGSGEGARQLELVIQGNCHLNNGVTLGTASVPIRSVHIGGDLILADSASINVGSCRVQGDISSTSDADCDVDLLMVRGDFTLDGGGSETWTALVSGIAGTETLNGATLTVTNS